MPAERQILGLLEGFVSPEQIHGTIELEFLVVQVGHVDRPVQEIHTVLPLGHPFLFGSGEPSLPAGHHAIQGFLAFGPGAFVILGDVACDPVDRVTPAVAVRRA